MEPKKTTTRTRPTGPGTMARRKKGFAAMTPEKVGEIAHKGGAARAAQLGHDGYVALGQLGGRARAEQLGQTGYAEMGRKGAEARALLQASRKQQESRKSSQRAQESKKGAVR